MRLPWCLLIALSCLLSACGEPPPPASHGLPWQIQVEAGGSRVFGISLGQTSFGEAAAALGPRYDVALFGLPEQVPSLEAFYSEVSLSGFTGKLILTLALPEQTLRAIRDRSPGNRVLAEGRERRWKVAEQDLVTVRGAPVVAISYIPMVNLEEDVVISRFGEPARRLVATDGGVHWLYPDRGLDLMLDPEGRELLQYVAPGEFDRLLAPLERGDPAPAKHSR